MSELELTDPRNPVATRNALRLPNIKALTAVRFFAALHVALYHLVRPFTKWGPLTSFFAAGYTGVSFFFVLSGFILTYSHAFEYERERPPASKFFMARFARIYPVYLLVMLASGWFHREVFHNKIHILAYVADLLTLQSWSTRLVNFFNVPAWSISVEAFFYLVFPFVLLRLRPASVKKALTSAGAFYLLAMAVPIVCLILWPDAAMHEYHARNAPGQEAVFAVLRLPILMLPEFLVGISLGWLYLRFRPSPRAAVLFMTGGIAGLVTCLLLADHLPYVLLHNGLLLPFFSMIIIGLCQENWLSRALSFTPLVLLGEASFALYLIHFNFNEWTQIRFPQSTIASALWKLALLIPVSILLNLFVERPARRAILTWWNARRSPAQ